MDRRFFFKTIAGAAACGFLPGKLFLGNREEGWHFLAAREWDRDVDVLLFYNGSYEVGYLLFGLDEMLFLKRVVANKNFLVRRLAQLSKELYKEHGGCGNHRYDLRLMEPWLPNTPFTVHVVNSSSGGRWDSRTA